VTGHRSSALLGCLPVYSFALAASQDCGLMGDVESVPSRCALSGECSVRGAFCAQSGVMSSASALHLHRLHLKCLLWHCMEEPNLASAMTG
jgi:hypothetical protein